MNDYKSMRVVSGAADTDPMRSLANKPSAATSDPGQLDGMTLLKFNAAAETLLPVLAKHFSDVNFVLTNGRLEVAANFRPLNAQTQRTAAPRDRSPMLVPQDRPVESPEPAGANTYTSPIPPSEHRLTAQGSATVVLPTRWWKGRKLMLAGSLGFAVAIAAYAATHGDLDAASRQTLVAKTTRLSQPRPAWAHEVDTNAVDGWVTIKRKFGLSDTALQALIRILKTSRYAVGDDGGLMAHPGQIERAFSILANTNAEGSFDLDVMVKELKGRLLSGARLPDEPPGGRYTSNLDPALYDNTIVVRVVETLHDHQDDAGVKNLLAALRQHEG